MSWKIAGWVYLLSLLLLSILSYSLTDPNLVLINFAPYWSWQQFMWRTFFDNRLLLTQCLTGLLVIMNFSYLVVWLNFPKLKSNQKYLWWLGGIGVFGLLLSYNFWSHDVFNYIFNAKMVVEYGANPHLKTALDFPQDPWLRFMHNVHTPAPYGYGWTLISLPIYLLGLGKFFLTWILFRLAALFSWLCLVLIIKKNKLDEQNPGLAWATIFNPLVLVEIISNMHNDFYMMIPAILSLYLISRQRRTLLIYLTSGVSLVISIYIKLATVALVPLWGVLATQTLLPDPIKKLFNRFAWAWPNLAIVLSLLPLLMARSKWFLPWYFTWAIVWLPFLNLKHQLSRWLAFWILSASGLLMLRYLPGILLGQASTQIFHTEIGITLAVLISTGILALLGSRMKPWPGSLH